MSMRHIDGAFLNSAALRAHHADGHGAGVPLLDGDIEIHEHGIEKNVGLVRRGRRFPPCAPRPELDNALRSRRVVETWRVRRQHDLRPRAETRTLQHARPEHPVPALHRFLNAFDGVGYAVGSRRKKTNHLVVARKVNGFPDRLRRISLSGVIRAER